MLALREIRRAKLRFSLLSAAVGLLVFLILFQQALLAGLVTDFIGAVRNQDSPILVFGDQARSNVEGSFLLPSQTAAIPEVEGVAESGPIGEKTFTVQTAAVTERQDAVLFGYTLGGLGEPTALSEGRLPEDPFEAVASAADVDAGFDIGDVVTIVGEEADLEITVVGLATESRWSVAPTLFASFETFEAAVKVVNPDAELVLPSLMAVRPADGVDLDALTARIDRAVPGVEALTNQRAVTENPGVQGVSQSFNIILALAFVVVVIVVAFFFLILTMQKARPLTLLRAIGAPRSYLVRNLVIQIGLVMLAGSAVGLAMAILVLEVAITGDLSVSLSGGTVATTLIALMVLALVGGLGAIRRVLAIDPIRATIAGGVM